MPRRCHKDHSYDPKHCELCREWASLLPQATGRGMPTALPVASSSPACIHQGEATGELLDCASCTGRVQLKVFSCDVHRRCLPTRHSPGVACCNGCPDLQVTAKPRVTQINRSLLGNLDKVDAAANARFNPSLLRWKGRLLFAYRTGWEGAQIHVATLSDNLVPLEVASLPLSHPKANYGREDPRLFVHQGKLHVSYIGVQGVRGGIVTNQMYARLSDDLKVEEIFYPHYAGRAAWEKNWQFFSSGDVLYAVYSVSPHRILKVEKNTATLVHQSQADWKWSGGYLRGGASPVLVGDRWVSWFHGAKQIAGWRFYNVGVYTFSATAPFQILSATPDPLAWAELRTKPTDVWAAVVFPCGAVLEDGQWKVSMGIHDRTSEVWTYSASHVNKLLRDVVSNEIAT